MTVIARPRVASRLTRRRPAPVAPAATELPAARPPARLSPAARRRSAARPQDEAMYTCGCGYVFSAAVSTSVGCPHCGDAQAW